MNITETHTHEHKLRVSYSTSDALRNILVNAELTVNTDTGRVPMVTITRNQYDHKPMHEGQVCIPLETLEELTRGLFEKPNVVVWPHKNFDGVEVANANRS